MRQPLRILKTEPEQDKAAFLRYAIHRFRDQILSELNIKHIEIHDPQTGPMLTRKASLKKSGFAKLGPKGKEAAAYLANLTHEQLGPFFTSNPAVILGVELAVDDLDLGHIEPAGWSSAKNRDMQVLLDARITPELKAEGMARDVVRFVQDARKDAGFDVADKIALYLGTESTELKVAIATHRETIVADTQAIDWSETPLENAHTANVKVDGQPLTIMVRKV